MQVKRRDRLVLMALIIGLCASLLWWAAGRSSGSEPPGSGGSSQTSAADSRGPSTSRTSTSVTTPKSGETPISGLATIAGSRLPVEAQDTLTRIHAGGPYAHDEDGGVFQNRERILPQHARGYYREYTVETPRSEDRGARRIIGGADGDLYYTSDHYLSFRQIEEGR